MCFYEKGDKNVTKVFMMNEKRFEVLFYGDVINCVRDETGKEYNLQEIISILMDQQATINKLKEENEQLRKQVAEYEMILRQHEFAEQEGFR